MPSVRIQKTFMFCSLCQSALLCHQVYHSLKRIDVSTFFQQQPCLYIISRSLKYATSFQQLLNYTVKHYASQTLQ
jgi:hypothetical protein